MIRSLAALLLCLFTTGCATMVNGRQQTLSIDSHPSGAAVDVDCGDEPRLAGKTPLKVEVSRAAEHCQLTFTRAGYEPRVVELSHQESRATVLNAAFGLPSAIVLAIAGGLIGSTVNGTDTGIDIGFDAGYDLGRGGATALDKKGGGWKWVPGRVFVILDRSEPREHPRADQD